MAQAEPTLKPTNAPDGAVTTPSIALRLASLPEDDRRRVLADLTPEEHAALEYHWPLWARPDQLPPPGEWRTWLLLGGRGAGKTRSAAEWVRAEIEAGKRQQLGIIGPTADAVRRIQVEGPSGILACAPPWNRPSYEPSSRRIVWPNGAIAHLFSAEEADRLRGPNLDAAWLDEFAAWPDAANVWDMLSMALRVPGPLGHTPQALITTTPRMLPILKAIMAAPSTVVTKARTLDNAANLDTSTLKFLTDRYGGTTLGRQELDAELLEDLEGALWTRGLLDECRVAGGRQPALRRIVVAIDPAGGSTRANDETGIIVVGRGEDGHGYVLADLSGRMTPEGWARRAVAAYHLHRADRIVVEQNFGGDMVVATIRGVDPNVPVKTLHASRGKLVRAEPVAALYEQHRIHHIGNFPGLEDQLCGWDPNGNGASPDRLDALVWAVSELIVEPQARPARHVFIDWMGR